MGSRSALTVTNNKGYWEFKWTHPGTGERRTVSVSRKLCKELGYTPTGKTGQITRDDAIKVRVLFEGMAEERLRASNKPTGTLQELFEVFRDAKWGKNSPGVRAQKETVVEDFLSIVGANRSPRDVTVADAVAFRERLLKKGLPSGRGPVKSSTARDYFRILKSMFTFGQRAGLVELNPFELVELPQRSPSDLAHFTPQKIREHLLKCASGPDREFVRWVVVGSFFLGLDVTETKHARWENFDRKKEALFIDVVKGKAGEARRNWVPVPKVVLPSFLARSKDSGFVWTSQHGQQLTKPAMDSLRNRIRADWPGFSWKSLRKSFAVFLQSRGVSVDQIGRVLRHNEFTVGRVASKHYMVHDFDVVKKTVNKATNNLKALAKLALPSGQSDT